MSGTSSNFTQTPNLGLFKPTYAADAGYWGTHLNANADKLDATLGPGGVLTWTATGGNTPRTAQDRSADVVNVLDYGAKGDGATDDTMALQAAINAAAGKAHVRVPMGLTCSVKGLTLPSNTWLELDGKVILASGSNADVFYSYNTTNVTITGCGTIDGNGTNQTAGTIGCIDNLHCSDWLIQGITIQNARNWNLNLVTQTNCLVQNVQLLNCGSSNEFAAQSTNCWIMNSFISGVNDIGFCFYGGITNSGIMGCTVIGSIGVLNDTGQKHPCTGIDIIGNFASGSTGAAYIVAYNGTISGTHSCIRFIGNESTGNNTVGGGGSGDFWINTGNDIFLADNLVHDSCAGTGLAYGFLIGASTSDVKLIGNEVRDVGTTANPTTAFYFNNPAYCTAANNSVVGVNVTINHGYSGSFGAGANFYNNSAHGTITTVCTLATPTDAGFWNPTLAGTGMQTAGPNFTMLGGSFFMQSVNAAVSLGMTSGGASGTPLIDFHSSGHANNDVRIYGSGGTGAGDGWLNVYAGTLNVVTPTGLQMYKVTVAPVAPGANHAQLQFVQGTNAGTAKLIAVAGTSATPVTVMDNIGAGF